MLRVLKLSLAMPLYWESIGYFLQENNTRSLLGLYGQIILFHELIYSRDSFLSDQFYASWHFNVIERKYC